MYELASLSIRTETIGEVLLALLRLVKSRYIALDHYLLLAMGERALVTIFALFVKLKILAHFRSKLVNVWSRWGEKMLSGAKRLPNTLHELLETSILLGVAYRIFVIVEVLGHLRLAGVAIAARA